MRRDEPAASANAPSRRDCLRFTGGTIAALALLPAARTAAAAQSEVARPRTPIPFHLGLASYTCRKFDLDKTLAMTRRVGLDRICLKSFHLPLDAKPAEIAAVADKVKAAGLVLYGGGVITMKTETDVTHAFEYAKAAGMTLITAAPTPEILSVIDDKIKTYDIKVAIHNHGPPDRHFPTPESVYLNIQNLDRRVGLCIDIGHTVRVGADLAGSVRKYGDRLFDLHIKDVTAATPKGVGTPLGRGIIDIPGLVRALIEVKFKGVAAFEYEEQPDDLLPGLAESVGYMRGVIAAI
ncbi:MAG: sugar phosphate isomerase/epimerase family protein [Isosphaeraceae bacterium]